uniref:Uncharacterized protein n=1 Tax=Rangifer tarandus platyrhynchus TaxID=3082113 RepID=A0ACB0EA41_RANTA|nr:unnamed protein product [Rangifer tarandus platyrhynchus]
MMLSMTTAHSLQNPHLLHLPSFTDVRGTQAARTPPPDGSRRFAIAPPAGSARPGQGASPRRPPAARPRGAGRSLPAARQACAVRDP